MTAVAVLLVCGSVSFTRWLAEPLADAVISQTDARSPSVIRRLRGQAVTGGSSVAEGQSAVLGHGRCYLMCPACGATEAAGAVCMLTHTYVPAETGPRKGTAEATAQQRLTRAVRLSAERMLLMLHKFTQQDENDRKTRNAKQKYTVLQVQVLTGPVLCEMLYLFVHLCSKYLSTMG